MKRQEQTKWKKSMRDFGVLVDDIKQFIKKPQKVI